MSRNFFKYSSYKFLVIRNPHKPPITAIYSFGVTRAPYLEKLPLWVHSGHGGWRFQKQGSLCGDPSHGDYTCFFSFFGGGGGGWRGGGVYINIYIYMYRVA